MNQLIPVITALCPVRGAAPKPPTFTSKMMEA
jgi:hypothetical protein